MQRLVEAYAPVGAPVTVTKLSCAYQAQREGVYASIDFQVAAAPEEHGEAPKRRGIQTSDVADEVEAVEFTFVLFDLFDNLLSSIQGIAGPGKYTAGGKKHKARWVFELDGAFSQYHAVCFPSQARFLDGTVWRCDRGECIDWLISRFKDIGLRVSEKDVFPEEIAREGIKE